MSDISPELLALGFIWYVAFLFSTTCHEAAHALAAKLGGDETAFVGGQVTLNPVPHIQREPWGMVIIPILSLIVNRSIIGWASAPYDPLWERRHPRRAAWMALAGPATNYSLMLIAAIGLRLGWSMGWLHEDPLTGRPDFGSNVLSAFFSLNPSAIWIGSEATATQWSVFLSQFLPFHTSIAQLMPQPSIFSSEAVSETSPPGSLGADLLLHLRTSGACLSRQRTVSRPRARS